MAYNVFLPVINDFLCLQFLHSWLLSVLMSFSFLFAGKPQSNVNSFDRLRGGRLRRASLRNLQSPAAACKLIRCNLIAGAHISSAKLDFACAGRRVPCGRRNVHPIAPTERQVNWSVRSPATRVLRHQHLARSTGVSILAAPSTPAAQIESIN